jgi:cell wall-associated NlpC family hydrolase
MKNSFLTISFFSARVFVRRILLATAVCVPIILISCVPPSVRSKDASTRHETSRSTYNYESDASISPRRKKIVRTALSLEGVPYRSGGSSPRGFDCSGLTMYTYKKNGVAITRTAEGQYLESRHVSKSRMKAGDLVFFVISGRNVSHVGIYIGGDQFVHAPSTGKAVTVEELDNPYWKPKLVGAGSYL